MSGEEEEEEARGKRQQREKRVHALKKGENHIRGIKI
jgi:hypothetical protein